MQDNNLDYLTPLGDTQFTRDSAGAPDTQLHIFCLEAIPEACHILISESYAGTLIGHTTAWDHEFGMCYLLATARALEFNYQLGLNCD